MAGRKSLVESDFYAYFSGKQSNNSRDRQGSVQSILMSAAGYSGYQNHSVHSTFNGYNQGGERFSPISNQNIRSSYDRESITPLLSRATASQIPKRETSTISHFDSIASMILPFSNKKIPIVPPKKPLIPKGPPPKKNYD